MTPSSSSHIFIYVDSTLWVAAYKDDGRTSVADETTKRFVEVDPYEHDEQLMPGLMEVSAGCCPAFAAISLTNCALLPYAATRGSWFAQQELVHSSASPSGPL
jgi:hypothetical protein